MARCSGAGIVAGTVPVLRLAARDMALYGFQRAGGQAGTRTRPGRLTRTAPLVAIADMPVELPRGRSQQAEKLDWQLPGNRRRTDGPGPVHLTHHLSARSAAFRCLDVACSRLAWPGRTELAMFKNRRYIKKEIQVPRTPSPTVRGRRLRYELRRLREQAGLTRDEVARRLEWSGSKVSRIETGQSRAQTGDVRDLLDIYGVQGDEAEALVQLAREARKRGWWTAYNDVFTGTYVGLEAEASAMRTYQPQIIPGLLETEDYARALIRAGLVRADPDEIERRVQARMARQEVLTRPDAPAIWAVLDEPIIRRPVGGPAVMRAQLQHLIDITATPNSKITLQILPLTVGAHPGLSGPFVMLDFPSPEDPPVVYLETATDGLYLEETAETERYTLMFDHLRASALSSNESSDLISRVAGEMA